jgi:RNA polymerase sigma-70 factor (ECF subfamily)
MTPQNVRATVEAVWRMESPKIIAKLARMLRDVGLAEELAQDALVTALEQWPSSGVPNNPGAWLMVTAKNRALDQLRRFKLLQRKHDTIAHDAELLMREMPTPEDESDQEVADDLLRLIFIACHPVLTTEARVALTLRLLGGLTTAEIARAFLVSEPTIGQRIVRAKRALSEARVPFEIPRAEELQGRIASVLEVIYLVFNEGYAATAGEEWMRPALCDEALRLGRILAELAPRVAEVHGLIALMEIQASRATSRVDQSGQPILLMDQDRSRWDQLLISRGLAALERAEALGGSLGPYALQAAIAACHGRARSAEETE